MLRWLTGIAASCLAAMAARADGTVPDCALALAFGMDISISVDAAEYDLQVAGLASALTDPDVADALLSQDAVALMAYDWSTYRRQNVMVPWTLIHDFAGLAAFANQIVGYRRSNDEYPTGLGNAITFGARELRRAPDCRRQVLDISGDGKSNDGFPPKSAYKAFPMVGVTVNGLVVTGAESDVVAYYLREVIRGPGAFVEIADGYEDFERAMKRKLLRELRVMQTVEIK